MGNGYKYGVKQLDIMFNEIIASGCTKVDALRSVFGTAYTGNLYEEYKINGKTVTGFAKLYTQITGKSFFTVMDPYSDNEYAKTRAEKTSIKSISPS